jgi:hypothetical protein
MNPLKILLVLIPQCQILVMTQEEIVVLQVEVIMKNTDGYSVEDNIYD